MKIADMHGDTIYELLTRRRAGKEVFLRENELHMDLQKMKKADYLLQNFALFVGLKEDVNPYEEAKAEYAVFVEELEKNNDLISQVFTYEDIVKNETTVIDDSEMGDIRIHEGVIASIARRAALSVEGVSRLAGNSLVDNL